MGGEGYLPQVIKKIGIPFHVLFNTLKVQNVFHSILFLLFLYIKIRKTITIRNLFFDSKILIIRSFLYKKVFISIHCNACHYSPRLPDCHDATHSAYNNELNTVGLIFLNKFLNSTAVYCLRFISLQVRRSVVYAGMSLSYCFWCADLHHNLDPLVNISDSQNNTLFVHENC